MNELNCKYISTEDLEGFNKLRDEMDILNDNDYAKAFELHKYSKGLYNRWSTILFDIRNSEKKGIPKNPALKDRVAQILKMIDDDQITSRMVWGKAKDDITGGKY